ncbi:hypothetical protein EYF80_009466 [Liparis tanakae]|uniref:Uncharacterized protein n=1 Tax=Liparis tanakae TaxID=230148 RepID=A0A4Z2IT10_9TELE|nr:hypothetical protein EYF80_009466 [Liparis tanakae]
MQADRNDLSADASQTLRLTEEPKSPMEGGGAARGPEPLCNRSDAKWSAVSRGHPRPAHLDNELRQYSTSGNWHIEQQLTAASSCMSQSHRRSAHVTTERQRYGVVAEALLSNMPPILRRYWEEGDTEAGAPPLAYSITKHRLGSRRQTPRREMMLGCRSIQNSRASCRTHSAVALISSSGSCLAAFTATSSLPHTPLYTFPKPPAPITSFRTSSEKSISKGQSPTPPATSPPAVSCW